MTRRDVHDLVIFARGCLYGMGGSLPSALLLVCVWIFAGYTLVGALRSTGDDGIGPCVISVAALVTATSGCVGLCRALVPPWRSTRRGIVKTLFCLIGGLFAISPLSYAEISDIVRRHGGHEFSPLDLIVFVFGGLALLYFVEAGMTFAWRLSRRMGNANARVRG
ncbi:hypothetical protein [Burkholderia sp. 22PA0106]|uniref:hypothetical protein n=1 Tax=Burkholderia sp. 22PA0106 TaxID=3237371 RepID=UPI0039C4E451